MALKPIALVACSLFIAGAATAGKPPVQRAHFPQCELSSGEVIQNCTVGYRVFGTPAPDGSNVVVLPTWYTGQSSDMDGLIGKTRIFDPEADPAGLAFVVLDAFGDNVSSSPSNSREQHGRQFPAFTIEDIVRWHHAVLTDVLGIPHVRAVAGVSMGGMIALQWSTQYPDYADALINIVGTPRPTAGDIKPWLNHLRATGWTWVDFRNVDQNYQLDAIVHHDIAPGLTLKEAAMGIKSRLLMIVSPQDTLVNAQPSLELASHVPNSKVLLLNTACGHLIALCNQGQSREAITKFLREL